MRYRLQRHDGTDCSATMVPFTVLRMVPIQRYRHTTAADAILDRLVHTSVRFELSGESLRQKKVSNQTENREND